MTLNPKPWIPGSPVTVVARWWILDPKPQTLNSWLAFVAGVVVDGVVLPADVAVIALGPWSSSIAGLHLPPVTSQKYHSLVVQPTEDVSNHMLFTNFKCASGKLKEGEGWEGGSPCSPTSGYLCAPCARWRLNLIIVIFIKSFSGISPIIIAIIINGNNLYNNSNKLIIHVRLRTPKWIK